MSDTTTDRLSRARAEMDAAHAELAKEAAFHENVTDAGYELKPAAFRTLWLATARHTRALRELFAATMEAAEPPKPDQFVIGRNLARTLSVHANREQRVAIGLLEQFSGTRADMQTVIALCEGLGLIDDAAQLRRSLEG